MYYTRIYPDAAPERGKVPPLRQGVSEKSKVSSISTNAAGFCVKKPWAIPHNSKCRYDERGAADAKPKAQIILDAAKVSAASGGNSEPKQGQRSQSARDFCPRSTMRVPQPDIIEHFGNADAVPQLPERCLSRKAGIVRCCLKKKRTIPARSGERALQGKNSSLFFHHIPLRKIFPCFGQDFAGAGLNVIGGQREVSAVGAS